MPDLLITRASPREYEASAVADRDEERHVMARLGNELRSEELPAALLRERDAVSRALLAASAGLAEAIEPAALLRSACDALASVSPHIRLACLYKGDPDAAGARPDYTAGPAGGAGDVVWWGGGPRVRPIAGEAQAGASALQLKSSIVLTLSSPDAREQASVVVYADEADYFRWVGMESFLAFAQLGRVALEQASARRQLQDLATIDALTGLLNRNALQRILEREHARAQRSGRPYTLLLFDIDRFKGVNDTYGHAVGDKALVSVANIARRSLREGDWLGRWGGDEFLCVLPDADEERGLTIAERLRALVAEQPVEADGALVPVSVSVGLAHFPQSGERLDRVMTSADAALYGAKRRGRNRVVASGREARGMFSIASQLEAALRGGRVQPAYQPIVDLGTGRVVGEEALARILTEEGGLLEAAGFIPAANQLRLVRRIDNQVLRQALARSQARVVGGPGLAQFVNVSADLLRHPELVRDLLGEHERGGGEAVRPLVLEIAEWEFLHNARDVRQILAPFLERGMQLAIDDFGSGYSSFQYLTDLPVSFVKIDGELVRRATRERRVRSILRCIRDIAGELELTTLAEWVEDETTAELLRDIGIQWAQGYYFGRPQLQSFSPAK